MISVFFTHKKCKEMQFFICFQRNYLFLLKKVYEVTEDAEFFPRKHEEIRNFKSESVNK